MSLMDIIAPPLESGAEFKRAVDYAVCPRANCLEWVKSAPHTDVKKGIRTVVVGRGCDHFDCPRYGRDE